MSPLFPWTRATTFKALVNRERQKGEKFPGFFTIKGICSPPLNILIRSRLVILPPGELSDFWRTLTPGKFARRDGDGEGQRADTAPLLHRGKPCSIVASTQFIL